MEPLNAVVRISDAGDRLDAQRRWRRRIPAHHRHRDPLLRRAQPAGRGVSRGVEVKYWRAVGHAFNVVAIESLVDQMAADQGMDPIDFRYQRMGATRKARKVFEGPAQLSDYRTARPPGRAVGISSG